MNSPVIICLANFLAIAELWCQRIAYPFKALWEAIALAFDITVNSTRDCKIWLIITEILLVSMWRFILSKTYLFVLFKEAVILPAILLTGVTVVAIILTITIIFAIITESVKNLPK